MDTVLASFCCDGGAPCSSHWIVVFKDLNVDAEFLLVLFCTIHFASLKTNSSLYSPLALTIFCI